MKFALSREHYHCYEKYGCVEFEGLVPEGALSHIRSLAAQAVGERPEELYLKGRDLWRRSESLKKVLFHRQLASVAADLTRKIPLRAGYDQYLPRGFSFEEPLTLREMGSLQGLVGGYLLSLEEGKEGGELHPAEGNIRGEEGRLQPIAPFSPRRGNVVFVHPEAPIDLSRLEGEQLLVAFCGNTAIYSHNERDPSNYRLKGFGYAFGDKIAEGDLPTLLRQFSL